MTQFPTLHNNGRDTRHAQKIVADHQEFLISVLQGR